MQRSHWLAAAIGLTLCATPVAVSEAHARVVVTERVVIRTPPPPLRREVIIASPGPRYAYVEGHWRWTGRDYDWVPGHWVERPRGRHGWVAGRWVARRGAWVWREGHWR